VFVELPLAAVDSHQPEQRFHPERPRFVRNDGHDELADLGIAQHLAQHRDEGHRRRYFPPLAPGLELFK
jgi:hypothetical protein